MSRNFRQIFSILPLAIASLCSASLCEAVTCVPAATPTLVRGEGITELTSNVVFNCTGGTANASLTVNFLFSLNVNVTNRLASATSEVLTGIALTADNGSGPQPVGASPTLSGTNTVSYNGATFTLSPSGAVTLQLSGLRGNASQLDFSTAQSMQLTVSVTGSTQFSVTSTQFSVGQPVHGLYVGYSGVLICTQTGSPAPVDATSFASFLAGGSSFTSTRLTEGFADAFAPKSDPQSVNADTGTRIVVQYSGFPAGAQLFVPTFVAGSDATQPTAGGDLGFTASGGKYTPAGSPSLLLALVSNTDANGAGGMVASLPAAPLSGTYSLDSMSPLTLANGSGIAVYEVINANPSNQESAQFPTFLVLAASGNGQTTITSENATLGPISTVVTATVTDPIPRFQALTPPADCTVVGDCNASYFPQLTVPQTSLSFTTPFGGVTTTNYVPVQNSGGGLLQWTASVTYANGSGWLSISPTQGDNDGTVRVDAVPGTLAPGTYKATLTVNAGPLSGTRNVPVTFVVTPSTTVPVPLPSVQSAVNAATFAAGPLTPGSIATLMGTAFSAQNESVTFNGLPAQVLFSNATQINLVVPAGLTGTTAQVVVSVNGAAGAPLTVNLTPFSPGIFQNGILNQDYSLNSSKQPAAPASIIQIFATGLSGTGVITAKIGSETVSQPYYAGPAPGFAGLQQVDLILPATISGNSINVEVCGGATGGQPVCSPPVAVAIAQ